MSNYISGNQGFIASHLLKRIEADGHDLKSGEDVTDNLWDKKYDVVYHLAAHLSPTDDKDIDLHRHILEYCEKSGAYLVYASSAAVYNPTSLYAAQKLYGEVLFKDIPHTTLRFFNVYGEGGHGIVDMIKDGGKILVNGNGEQRRDFVHVEDVVDAILTAGETRMQGTFDVGTGYSTTVNDLLMYFRHVNYEYVPGDTGVADSFATQNLAFPWFPKSTVMGYALDTYAPRVA